MIENSWELANSNYNFTENKKYETLFTLANGYRGIRGSIAFSTMEKVTKAIYFGILKFICCRFLSILIPRLPGHFLCIDIICLMKQE